MATTQDQMEKALAARLNTELLKAQETITFKYMAPMPPGDQPPQKTYEHPEAFCLMHYEDDLGNVEIIWNSRDGVTPFIVNSRQGREMKHVRWNTDRRKEDHVPRVGDRVFEDLTEQRARKWREQYVSIHWRDMADSFATREDAVEELVKSDLAQAGSPMITVVDEEWLKGRGHG